MTTLPSTAEETVSIEIGGMPIAMRTHDPSFRRLIENRYAGFVGTSPHSQLEFDIDLYEPSDAASARDDIDDELEVKIEAGEWLLRRGDFRARWSPEASRGHIRQSPSPYAIDAVLRIVHSLVLARQGGFANLSADQIAAIVGEPMVDAGIDAVGFEAHGHGSESAQEAPAAVLNSLMRLTVAGGAVGIPGLYVTDDPGGVDQNAKVGNLGIRIGLGWAKSHAFTTGQCPVMRYHRQLMQAILYDKIQIAKAVNVTVISLDDAPRGYHDFDKGAARKYVIDPHAMLSSV